MKRLWVVLLGAGLLIWFTGCFVSETDYQKVVTDREVLQKELADAKEENHVLNQAVVEAYKERDNVLRQMEDCRTKLKQIAVVDDKKPGTPGKPTAAPDEKKPGTPGKPAAGTDDKKPTFEATRTYEVKAGDTLSIIARQHGVSLEALMSVNNLGSDVVWVGQKLKVP